MADIAGGRISKEMESILRQGQGSYLFAKSSKSALRLN